MEKQCIIIEMDERALIINAIKQKHTSEVGFDFSEPDAIDRWVKRKKKQESFKSKQIDEWTNVDFLNYLDFMLKEFGVSRVKGNTRRDSDKINQLHDRLVKQLTIEMNNSILKEYLEWWSSIWAPRLTGSEFHLNLLIQEYQIIRFASRYKKKEVVEASVVVEQKTSVPNPINDANIYDLGGLSLLVMKRGIVAGYRFLKSKGISDAESVSMIQKTIGQFNKEVLVNVLKITLQESYPKTDKVDFISLTASALNRFGLTEYFQIPYGTYFKE